VISGCRRFLNIPVGEGVARFALAVFVGWAPPAVGAEDPGQRLAELRREMSGARPPTASQVCSRLNDIALEYLESGDAPRAIELLSEAVGRDPDNGTALANLILAYLKHEDFEFAGFYLELATQTTTRRQPSPNVYRAIGDFYAARHRLEDAVTAWDYYLLLGGGDPTVLARVEQARRELSVTPGQRLLENDHFALYTDAAISPETAAQVEKHLEQEYRRQSTSFATELAGRQVVILYGGRAYFSLVSVPNWISGIFDGKIRISLEPVEGWTSQLAAVLSHELAHAFIRKASRGRAPGWIHEGLAQWCEGRRIPRAELRVLFTKRKPLALAEMEHSFRRPVEPFGARSSYAEALGLIEFLVARGGEGSLTCLLQDLGDGLSLEESLQREINLSTEQLIPRWMAWILG
jgi:hypothetical protein